MPDVDQGLYAEVAALNGGGFVVEWWGNPGGPTYWGPSLQLFDVGGAPVGENVAVGYDAGGSVIGGDIAVGGTEGGGFHQPHHHGKIRQYGKPGRGDIGYPGGFQHCD